MKNCIINKEFFVGDKCSAFTFIKDKEELLNNIKKFKLPFQSQIKTKVKKYGTEIEFTGAPLDIIYEELRNSYNGKTLIYTKDWFAKKDESITDAYNLGIGGELVSPILTNKKMEWTKLVEVCDILKENDAFINDDCSLHLHFDFNRLKLDTKKLKKLLKLWAIYEPVIYKFCLGD